MPQGLVQWFTLASPKLLTLPCLFLPAGAVMKALAGFPFLPRLSNPRWCFPRGPLWHGMTLLFVSVSITNCLPNGNRLLVC